MEWVALTLGILGVIAAISCYFWGKAVGHDDGFFASEELQAERREAQREKLLALKASLESKGHVIDDPKVQEWLDRSSSL